MNDSVMQLRAQYLHQEVMVVDGSSEDGQCGYVTSVTARSAEPLTVLFWTYETVRHQNYYRPQDVVLTGREWQERRERDQTVRCRQSRFDGLWRIIDGKGPHGNGCGTTGGAWRQYLDELAGVLPGKEDSGHTETASAGTVAGATSPVDHVAGADSESELSGSVVVGQGTDDADAGAREEAGTNHRA
jgi:hypothetical protein